MNLLFSCIGKRGYIADYFRPHLRAGERIIGTSSTPWTPGFQACDLGLLLPPIASDAYIPALLEACRTHEIGGLLSFFDPDVIALSAHLDALRALGVVPILPDATAAGTAFDKWRTFQTLRDAGFAVPDTTISLAQAKEDLAAGRLRFPLIVKPRTGYGSANVFIAHDKRQLEAFFLYGPDMMVQAFIEGPAFNIEALGGLDGEVLQVVAWQKHLSRLGETEQAVTVRDPALIALGRRLAETVGLVGPMDVDLIRAADGTLYVIELNLRFGGGYPVSHLAGADFPGMIVEMMRGARPTARIGDYRAGICMMKGLQVMGGPAEPFLQALRAGAGREVP